MPHPTSHPTVERNRNEGRWPSSRPAGDSGLSHRFDPQLRNGADQDPWPRHVTYARTGDPAVLAELAEHYRGYAAALARRLHRDGESLEDLRQVAMEALLQALQRFDLSRSIPFTAFATPTIVGSLKRHYRDRGWALRVPRQVHELVGAARRTADDLAAELGRPARPDEVAERLGVSVEALLRTEEAAHARAARSLDVLVNPDQTLGDLVGADDKTLQRAENRIALGQALKELSDGEREVLDLYFTNGWSQQAIGARFGVSQMQISRQIASSIRRLRSQLVAS